ncbi:putative membrane protein [Nocardia nova SH22a]|uniref:Putative membrane protein n=1 Tax=Nocardia nova SH22a TaxID=1415166 RepID=W5TPK0_9NOCA|nr:putative membrane protein [Nocardia nova SH22a]
MPGVPAGAAVLIAVACTFIGFFIDSGSSNKELTHVFAAFYLIGCLIAACVVRYRGLFTTMVTPPLLLFIAVPLAYQQLTGHSSTSVKDILLNLAIPLVNRFPTMAVVTVLVLCVGALRVWLYRNADTAPRPARDRARGSDSWNPRSDRARRSRSAASGADETLRGSSRTRKRDTDAPKSSKRGSTAKRGETTKRAAAATKRAAEPEPARAGRRAAGKVAERPPRVSPGASYPRAGERTRTAERTRVAEPQPRRGRPQPANDVPPHPRPNVRYRDR